MRLTALRLYNVRRFAGCGIAIENIGDGVNVLCAANEYGKSTCFDALHALFFQPHSGTPGAVQSLRPYSGGNPLIEADIATQDGRLRLTKQFYGGRRATVIDLSSGRLVAQADEAERLIADLVSRGPGGPAGLLWVRQGVTGLERRSRGDEEGEKRARESVLSSVQGEVEAMTGGRRMVEAMAACEEELSRLVTPTGRPKAGGAYALAVEEHERLAEVARRLEGDVRDLREALDARRRIRARLEELAKPEEEAARRGALEQAQKAFDAAQRHADALQAADAEAKLLRGRHEKAATALDLYRTLLASADKLREQHKLASGRRKEARERQRGVIEQGVAAAKAVDAAEAEEREARNLLARLERAMRSREAAERLAEKKTALEMAEAARNEIEESVARLRALDMPADALQALERIETEIAGLCAARTARAPTVRVEYESDSAGAVVIDGTALADGEERALTGVTKVNIARVGTLTVTTKDPATNDTLSAAEERRRKLLEKLGVQSFAGARQRNNAAAEQRTELGLAKQRLALLAPDGIEMLRGEIARLESEEAGELELKGDPIEVRRTLATAELRLSGSRTAAREIQPARDKADLDVVEAEKALAAITAELAGVESQLGPEAERAARLAALERELTEAQAPLAEAEAKIADLRAAAPDVESAEAGLRRAKSIVEAASTEAARLREHLADLNGRIRTRSEDAVEEHWREAVEAFAAAQAKEARIEREVALLTRLRDALGAARSAARDHYFEPVMRELRPLLGLLFEEAAVVFDDESLLPRTVQRNGQIEEVERLSGGMREQLAILTRLAFAKLLARDNRPTPIILDDALVYSDDDRIEKMFDALHRQSRDQQIIVFSCRQRAFARLGGNALEMTEWSPPQV